MLNTKQVVKLIGLWPPYLFAGVSVKYVSDDFFKIRVQMKQKLFNTNYVGSHFGGSLYSMCDPWFMFMLIEHLGSDYIVWDKAASIDFKSPGKGVVFADFELNEEEIERVKKLTDHHKKYTPNYTLNVYDQNGKVVAEVHKTLYVRRKDSLRKN